MEILKLQEDQKQFFAHLDPFGFMSASGLPGAFALGAVVKEGGNDVPAGLCVVRRLPGSLRIEWLAVDGPYQMQGIGDEICYSIVNLAKEMGLERVEAAFYRNPGRDELCEGEQEYFADKGFEKDSESCWFASLALSDMPELPYFEGYRGVKKLVSLDKMTTAETAQMAKDLSKMNHFGAIAPLEELLPDIRKDLSFSIPSGEGTAGVVLVCESNGLLAPVAMGAEDDALVPSLLFTSLEAAMKEQKPSDWVIVAPTGNVWERMLDTILVDKLIGGSIMTYKVGD